MKAIDFAVVSISCCVFGIFIGWLFTMKAYMTDPIPIRKYEQCESLCFTNDGIKVAYIGSYCKCNNNAVFDLKDQ
jgi:hypothetical protein